MQCIYNVEFSSWVTKSGFLKIGLRAQNMIFTCSAGDDERRE